jgi:hypothetical protein
MTPRQLGPSRRVPKRRAARSAAADSAAPSGPASAKPAEITITAGMPLRPQSSTTAGTWVAGTTTIARSTGPSTSPTAATARTPATSSAAGLTAYTGPGNRWSSTLRSTAWPTPPASRPAPMTATDEGSSSRRTASASARWARAVIAASAPGVGRRSSRTSITPSPKRLAAVKPALRNTPTMRPFEGSTVAVNAVMPVRRAASARYSSRTVAMPRP